MIKKFFTRHFAVSQLSLKYDDPSVFINSQWQTDKSQQSIIYLIYRTCQTVIFLSIFGILTGPHSYVFLTFWSYTLDTFQSTLGFAMLCICLVGSRLLDRPQWKEMALKAYPLYWLASNTSTVLAFMVTIIYWPLVYNGEVIEASNVFAHAVQTVQLLIDLCVSERPVRIFHFLYGLLFGSMYTIFNVCFYFIDRKNGGNGVVYPILDWGYPAQATTTVLGCYVLLILLNIFIYGVYRLRVHIHDIYMKKGEENEVV